MINYINLNLQTSKYYNMKRSKSNQNLLHQDIQIIKEDYLKMHFEQIKSIMQRNYHYAFKIIKSLAHLKPSNLQLKLQRMIIVLSNAANHCCLQNQDKENVYNKNHAYCLDVIYQLIIEVLLRKMYPLLHTFYNALSLFKPINKWLPKDKQMFLRLKKANLNKLIKFTIRDSFDMIKSYAKLQKKENKQLCLINMMHILKSYINKLSLRAFHSILSQNRKTYNPQHAQQDQAFIFIETYKNMAINFARIKESQNSAPKMFKMKLGAESINDSLASILQHRYKWAFSNILCFENYKLNSSVLQILQKQIAILQKEYEST